mgnify:CR=1 FL=1
MLLVQNDHMVQAVAAQRPNQSLDVRALPGRSGGDEHLLDVKVTNTAPEVLAICPVTVSQEAAWSGLLRESVHRLLGGPLGAGTRGHVEVQNASAVVREDEKAGGHPKRGRRHDEEVDGDQVLEVIVEEGASGGGGRPAMPNHVLGDGGAAQLDSELGEFVPDAGSASVGFERDILRIRSRASQASVGQAPRPDRLLRVQ